MNIKQRFSLIFSILFSVILGSVLCAVYIKFSNFRREEFRRRLFQRAETTARLLSITDNNTNLVELVDKNRTNKLYNEKTSVFNARLQRLYTSNRAYNFNWSKEDFAILDRDGKLNKKRGDVEVLGMLYSGGKRKFYILISAQDLYESRSLHYLRYVLLAAFLAGMALVWGLSFFLSRASLLPLDTIRRQFSEISGRSLTKRLPVSGRHDEIDGLVASFNLMMDRIDMAYRAQKQFTADASHELRAPLSRLTAKMENLIRRGYDPSSEREPVQAMLKDTHRLSDMLSALLQLTELDDTRTIEFASLRIDDVIFDAAANFSRLHEGFQFNVDIQVENEQQLLIHGNESLLKIALTNIFKNAYLYSLNQAISCRICTERDHPVISFTNNGKSPEIGELALLFNTFYRGNNAKGKAGSGLGLSIVQRIVERHSGLITFRVPGDNVNVLTLAFLIP